MSGRLPVISGQRMVRVLEKIGYRVSRQRGSHVRLKHPDGERHRPTTVPLHRELQRGTLLAILADADLSPEALRELL